jgi:cyclic pyranopterin monophosphate synthase
MQVAPELSAAPTSHRFGARMTGRARLTHLDGAGRARMVDVGDKAVTTRVATAAASVLMRPATLRLIAKGALPKGDVLAVARLAGIMAAKRTAELIPLCHPLPLSYVDVQLRPRSGKGRVDIEATVRIEGRTGVEMEALTAVSVAALTVYDMCKAVDRDIEITAVRLLHKEGGKSGRYVRRAGASRT